MLTYHSGADSRAIHDAAAFQDEVAGYVGVARAGTGVQQALHGGLALNVAVPALYGGELLGHVRLAQDVCVLVVPLDQGVLQALQVACGGGLLERVL